MNLAAELESLLAANVPFIQLVTYEEDRVLQALEEMGSAQDLGIHLWDVAGCCITPVRVGKQPMARIECTSDRLLDIIVDPKTPDGQIFVLRDFHHCWASSSGATNGVIVRKLRNIAPILRERHRFLIFLTPEASQPVELRHDVVVLRVPLPDVAELNRLFDDLTQAFHPSLLPGSGVRGRLISSALGLTTNQAKLAFSRVWAHCGCFDERGIDITTSVKRDIIRESGALEFWPVHEGEGDVGGLDQLKGWLAKREKGFSDEARAANVPYPRGVALIGIPGTGKSLTAKMVSGMWRLPLLRLDVGALFGAFVGQSEANLRRAIELAETVSPCLLWIDEMEKAFGGANAASLGSGTAARVFGTFLTWMQEHRSPVFVIATANDVSALAPELMGRFDRTFFLDLPNDVELREIFVIHLRRANIAFPERQLDLDELVERSRGFVGREIEQLVREAQFTAFADQNRVIEQEDLLQALREIVPLSRSHVETIDALRLWKTEGRAFPASSESKPSPGGRRRVIETL